MALLLSGLKTSFIIGTRAAFFSANALFEPLIGLKGKSSALYVLLRTGITLFFHKTVSWFLLCAHLPLLGGAGYFAVYRKRATYKIVFSILYVVCMALFASHSVGATVWWYSLLWFIPLATLISNHESFFLHALGSTMTNHAIGTLVWLYFSPTTPQFWIQLLPIVCIERLTFALGLTISYYLLQQCALKITVKSCALATK